MNKHAIEIARKSIKIHEGLRLKPYDDTNGRPDLGDNGGKITIGYGRNLQEVGITLGEAEMMLDADIRVSVADAESLFPNIKEFSAQRQAVLIEMSYNLGRSRLARFKRMREALDRKDFNEASKEMLDSKWHRDFVMYAKKAGRKEHNTRSFKLASVMVSGDPWWV